MSYLLDSVANLLTLEHIVFKSDSAAVPPKTKTINFESNQGFFFSFLCV